MTEHDGITLWMTCEACPLQIEGHVDGVPLYFRSRYGRWRIGIGDDPVGITIGRSPGFYRTGNHPEFSGRDACREIVHKCIAEWRAEVSHD